MDSKIVARRLVGATTTVNKFLQVPWVIPLQPWPNLDKRDGPGVRETPQHPRADAEALGCGTLVEECLPAKQTNFLVFRFVHFDIPF
jgi:hypothetical protein